MLTRRSFLSGSCALGVTAAASPLLSSATVVPDGGYTDYRALVCVLLGGGNDSFNMLVPHSKRQFDHYCAARGNLALDRHEILELPGGRSNLALHGGMPELHELFLDGHAALLAGVGTLGRPFSRRPAQESLPIEPMAHAAQLEQWQSCAPAGSATGWAGRIADVIQNQASENGLAMNISLSGINILQSGALTSPVLLKSGSYRDPRIPVGVDFQYLNNSMTERRESSTGARARRRKARLQRSSIENAQRLVAEAPELKPELSASFGDDPLSLRLADVARAIAARETATARRQIFFVQFDGWDHHHRLLESQATMLRMLSQGLKSFRDALQSLGVLDAVTTFTVSEFGRSLASNGTGSDHGWAGNQIVMGGAISGGIVHGHYPDLSPDSPAHIGGGVIAPTTSNDEYFADLAVWLGLPPEKLGYVLPNLAGLGTHRNRKSPVGLFS